METLLMLLAVVGISTGLSQTEGPFGLAAWLRGLLVKVPVIGSLLVSILSCNFCLGFWSSFIVFLLTGGNVASLGDMAIWMFAGGAFNSAFNTIIDRFATSETVEVVKSEETV